MLPWLKRIAIGVVCVALLVFYREWVQRHQPVMFLPLGFENTVSTLPTPEESARDPRNWEDPLSSLFVTKSVFDLRVGAVEVIETDVLTWGGTLGGASAAISAADGGVRVVLASNATTFGDEWAADIPSLLKEKPSLNVQSSIEQRLHAWLEKRHRAPTLEAVPSDLALFFREEMARLPSLQLLQNYSIAALSGTSSTELTHALLRKNDNGQTVVVRFKTLIDGTEAGELFAYAGVPTRSGWESKEETNEEHALPAQTLSILEEGLTTSGGVVPGLGRRLDGASDVVALLDRGYHGEFVSPSDMDASCWEIDSSVRPFVSNAIMWRARKTGCTATFTFPSQFQDTVELFAIAHENERLHATVEDAITGISLDIDLPRVSTERFVRLGVFSVDPVRPLKVTVHTELPGEFVEGIIARKRNANVPAQFLTAGADGLILLKARAWRGDAADIYIKTATLDAPRTPLPLRLDNEAVMAERVGRGTWVLRNVALTQTERKLHGPDGASFLVVPVSPLRGKTKDFALATKSELQQSFYPGLGNVPSVQWTFSPEETSRYALFAHNGTCMSQCAFTIAEAGSLGILLSGITDLSLLGTVELTQGRSYVFTLWGKSLSPSPTAASMARLLPNGADLLATGISSVAVTPTGAGGVYDVWVRAPLATSVTLSSFEKPHELVPIPGDTYVFVGSRYLTPIEGMRVTGNGELSMYAIANASIDTYRLAVPAGSTTPHSLAGLPAGLFRMWWHGTVLPTISTLMNGDHIAQHISFDVRDINARAENLLIRKEDEPPLSLAPGSSSADRLLTFVDLPPIGRHGSGTLVPALSLPSIPSLIRTRLKIGSESHGILFLDASPRGIGPITLGQYDDPSLHGSLRTFAENLLPHIRSSIIPKACSNNDTPLCDERRLTRASFVFATSDGHSPRLRLPDIRRLIGHAALTEADAFLDRTNCTGSCTTICVGKLEKDGQCVARTQHTMATQDIILSVEGVSQLPIIESPREAKEGVLKSFLKFLRESRILSPELTMFETRLPPRTVSLTLDMFIPTGGQNILPGNTTVSATHIASRSLRSVSTELAIGSAAGYIAAFTTQEHLPLSEIRLDASSRTRLQLFLVRQEVNVFSLAHVPNDPLLLRALQEKILTGESTMNPSWSGATLIFSTNALTPDASDAQRVARLFGRSGMFTLKDLLVELYPDTATLSADDQKAKLLEVGLLSGVLSAAPAESVLSRTVDKALLLKGEILKAQK